MNFINDLNHEQLTAVTTDKKYVSVIAGAGSGKTRVLTYRISFLLSENIALPSQILGITFTNKAAKEIKERVLKLIPGAERMTLSTIHSFCARFLRIYIDALDIYQKNFTIIDEEDQKTIMKNLFVSKGLTKTDERIKEAMNFISSKKGEGLEYQDIADKVYPNHELNFYKECFADYDAYLKKTNSLDFDDLILLTIKILEDDVNGIRKEVTKKYHHILVDEFQDIDDVQFHLITLLMNQETSLYVVGDPDQTIYTWRGANNKILLDLEKNLSYQFRNVTLETIVLKNNYRSTKNILDASNALIAHNKNRIKKDLVAVNGEGDNITVYNAYDGEEESSYVASMIDELVRKGENYKNIAVLYRSNYLSRELESQLNLMRIPYQIFGGIRFFARKEIKDLLAYFNLFINPSSDISFDRIINVPKRNIGPTSLDKIKTGANSASQPIYYFLKENLSNLELPKSKLAELEKMINIIDATSEKLKVASPLDFGDVIKKFIDDIHFYDSFSKEDDKDERIDNVKELIGNIKLFFNNNQTSPFADFVENASLQASGEEINDGNYVSLMTVHSAKGLEFNEVFIFGFNDGVFPSARSVSENAEAMEEERRLAYVAFTRAKKHLYVSFNNGFSYVQGRTLVPSPFLKEAGLKVKEKVVKTPYNGKNIYKNESYSSYGNKAASKVNINKPIIIPQGSNNVKSWNVGDLLKHADYGVGKVIEVVSDKIIKVKFENKAFGEKTLLSTHIKISKLES